MGSNGSVPFKVLKPHSFAFSQKSHLTVVAKEKFVCVLFYKLYCHFVNISNLPLKHPLTILDDTTHAHNARNYRFRVLRIQYVARCQSVHQKMNNFKVRNILPIIFLWTMFQSIAALRNQSLIYTSRKQSAANNIIFERYEYENFIKSLIVENWVEFRAIAWNVLKVNISGTLTQPVNEA